MTTKTTIRETDIASVVVAYLKGCGMQVRTEVPVLHPTEGLVSIDVLAWKEDTNRLTVVECKRQMNAELESQCKRWLGRAHAIIAAHIPHKRYTTFYYERIERLYECSIAHMIVSGDRVGVVDGYSLNDGADTRLLMEAFRSHDGTHDAQAGSAAAKRMTPERCAWEPLRKYLAGTTGATWKYIRREVPEMRRYTSAAAVKAIDRGECVGVTYAPGSPVEFYPTKEKK